MCESKLKVVCVTPTLTYGRRCESNLNLMSYVWVQPQLEVVCVSPTLTYGRMCESNLNLRSYVWVQP